VGRRSKNRAKKTDHSLKQRWLVWYANFAPVLYFGLKFGGLLALLYILLATPFFDRALYGYLEANAWLANVILHGLGQQTHVSEVTIQSPQFNMAIRRGCDAVEPTWLLCAAMISFPASWIHKLWGMAAAIVLLQFMNLVRIVSLYWIGIHVPGLFNSAHMELWPTVFIVAAIAFFVGWKESSHRPKPHVEAKP
jgi:exosortase/archaeosortase family protein